MTYEDGLDEDEAGELIKCLTCDFEGTQDEFDQLGSCPGNLFCNSCGTEINPSTGMPSQLCGECPSCHDLEADGSFDETWNERAMAIAKLSLRTLRLSASRE